MSELLRIAVVGNPNVGKTSLFNALTGARHRVGNYAGVTVERRSARLRRALVELAGGSETELIDLPGCYSLTPYSEDEAVAFRCLAQREAEPPQVALLVLDATNLARNLYLLLQVGSLGLPVVVALNMMDEARRHALPVDAKALSEALGVPVVETVARDGEGLEALARALPEARPVAPQLREPAPGLEALIDAGASPSRARFLAAAAAVDALDLVEASAEERAALASFGPELLFDRLRAEIDARYAQIDELLAASASAGPAAAKTPARGPTPTQGPMARSASVDRWLTHRFGGPLIFIGVMALVFQSIFAWADPAIGVIESAVGGLSGWVQGALGPGALSDLATEGVLAGVGNVIVFIPQIALLFAFIAVLEDTGYMARAAFIIDRIMAKVGLNGRSFVPLLSGYACAVPAIMGTRTIRNFRDRLVTILMIPFVSCSARLPIYALIIGALFDADKAVLGPFTQGGLILLGMYLLSTLSALAVGALYRRTLLKGPTPPLVLELPPYRWPRPRSVLREVFDRCMDFLRDAGTTILAATIVLWGLLSYPKPGPDADPELSAIELSIGGRVGKTLEPLLEPIGQDWRTGIGIIGSFAAREVFVSTLGLVYGIEGADEDDAPLREQISGAVDEEGKRRYTPLKGLALMVFFVYACQCMSTLAVVRRETRSWKWPLFMLVSMTALAYVAAFAVYQGGRLLGFE